MKIHHTRKNNITFVLVVTAMALLSANSILGVDGNVFAKKTEYNQASSLANACGNAEFPMNVLCQNLDSEIQGDGNAVNVIGLQTGGKILRETPEDRSCEECFERFLTAEQIDLLIQSFVITESDGSVTPFTTLEQVCKFLELIADVGVSFEADVRAVLVSIGVDPVTIDLVIDCLIDAGVITS